MPNNNAVLNSQVFDFSNFFNVEEGRYQYVSSSFLEWFVGFVEGDGCFTVTSRNDLSFVITQSTEDIQVLYKICNTLGFGSVITQGPRTSRFVLQNLGDLFKILLILNGNLMLPSRQKKFRKFLDAFNQKVFKRKKYGTVSYIQAQYFPSLNDAWFSGFVDAEGCFSVSFLRGSSIYRIRCVVRQKGRENLPLLSSFILMFHTGSIEAHSKDHNYSFVISGKENCSQIFPYFENFPLKTKKAESYQLWKQIHQHLLDQDHLNKNLLPELIEKAKMINQIHKKTTN